MPSVLLRLIRLIGFLAILGILCTPVSGLCAENGVVFGPRDVTVGAWGVAASVHRFECAASGEGSLVVSRRMAGKSFRGGFVLVNNSFFSLHEFLEGSQPVFVAKVNLRKTNVIGLTLIGAPGAALGIEVRAKSGVDLPQVTFSATPESIRLGEGSTLQWTSTAAASLSIAPGIGNVPPSGSQSISPQATTTYTLTASGPGGSVTRTATVTVIAPPPTVSLSISPASISTGETVALTWSSTNAESATIVPGIGSVAPSGTVSASPLATTTYTITAVGSGGTTQASATVTVHTAPSVTFSAGSASIPLGGSTTLNWSTTDAQGAHIDQGIGSVPLQGTRTISPTATTTYTLTASGPGGTAGATATVSVFGSPAPQPPGSFGKSYQDQVPPDATVEAYDVKRFALVTGLVRDALGAALEDVAISIFDHPGYGTTATDRDGRFTLPVEGGGILSVRFRKPGFISAQRQIQVPWNDTAVVETVSLISEDAAATIVKFDGSAATVVTHRSTEVSDSSGTRAATMVFTGDNKAYLTDKAGNKTLELATITTRATEFTTPESMPAKLPPTSAFTWCAELGVDGAERVKFEKPVVMWVENFLNFPVGEIVPVGYYDRDKATWLPQKNGVVVALLDTDGDGVVDALDADGDGQPDDLNKNGQFTDEVRGLTDNQKFSAGATFWRAETTHFSVIDFNWPFGLPPGAIPPNSNNQAFADVQREEGKDAVSCLGSFVEEKSRIFHEDISIPGTDLKLHYSSSRTAGYKPGVITIPASGNTVPQILLKILVRVEVAGRKYEVTLPPAPKQVALIEWDGLDHLGRPVSGTVSAHVQIGFVYHGVYYRAPGVGDAFGQPGFYPLIVPTRQESVSWKSVEVPIIRGIGTIAEGWSLSAHHYVSPMDSSRIFKGDGTIGTNNTAIIETVAGDGTSARVFGGMGGPAVKAQIGEPYHVATDAEGNLYIGSAELSSHAWGHHILKVDRKGIVTEVIHPPGSNTGFARDPQGNYYQSWDYYNCIYKVDTQQSYTRLGTCNPNDGAGFSGDGGPATAARFNYPSGIAIDPSGNVYIADKRNNRIRKIDANGTITTFAGSGAAAGSGDGGRATEAGLSGPISVASDGYGNIFIAEEWSRRVRKVDPSGTIVTVAGNGTWDFKGNGVLATETGFYDAINSIAVEQNGTLYIVNSSGNRVYKVDTGGIVSTVAGSGPMGYGGGGFEGDGGAATAARLNYPTAVAVDPSGGIYIADQYNQRVRRVAPQSARLAALMGPSDIAFSEENGSGYILSAAGLHKMTIELATGVILREFLYDTDNGLTAIVDAFDNRTLIERGAGGVVTAIVSPDGIRTVLSINTSHHLTGITYPGGGTYAFDYSVDGLELRKTQPAGNRFGHSYDSHGRMTDYTDDEGGHWQLTNRLLENGDIRHETLTAEGGLTMHVDRYAASGAFQSTVTDAAGAQTVVNESADGLTVASMLACGINREEVYDLDAQYKYKYLKKRTEQSPSGLKRVSELETLYTDADKDSNPEVITRKLKVNGRTSLLTHDIGAAKKALASAEGRTLTAYYDPETLVTEKLQVPGLLDILYTYDNRGRLTQAAMGNRATFFGYNAQGFLGSVTDAQGRSTSFVHDALGRVKQVSRPDQSQIHFDYDENGSMTVLANPSGVAHKFGYNKVNHQSAYTTPLSGSYLYKYDKDRRPTEMVFPSGRTIRNVYDQGRLARTETPETSIYFNYLCGSKLASITKSGEGISYTYDGSLLTLETSSGSLDQVLSYSYNNDFARVQASYAGQATGYGYDNDGLLTQAGPFAITRHAGNGLPVSVSGAGLQLNRGFNGHGELDSQAVAVGGRAVGSWSLLRDNAGRIVRKAEAAGGPAASYDYVYDANGRLVQVLKDGVPVEEYRYDENGTRVFEMNTLRGIVNRSYEYSDEDHLLKAGEWAYQYDPDGFLTNKTNSITPSNKTHYFYTSRGELLTVILPDGKRIDYVCDPLGRRIAKKVNGVVVEKYLCQGLTRLLAVYDGGNILRQRFEYADERMPVAMKMGSATYYLSYDQVGSLRLVADASGNVVKGINYDSFGNILEDTNPSFTIPFGFAGGLHDRDTGLVRFGYRDYDPEVGRWTAKDPIGFAGGDTDLYGYVLNDSVNLIDPRGLFTYANEYGTTGTGLTTNITNIEVSVDSVFQNIVNRDAVVTYTTNGTHSPNSLHYGGNAIDLRTRDMTATQRQQAATQLQNSLGNNYQVINEGDHIHIEYDPPTNCP